MAERGQDGSVPSGPTNSDTSDLAKMGVQQHDEVLIFWECFGKRMARFFPEAAERALEIASQVAAHGIVTVGGMADLSLEALEECILVGGGNVKWAKAVYSLVQSGTSHPTRHHDLLTRYQPPPSAALVSSMKKQPCAPRFEGGPLGATLIKDGTLGALILPRDRLLAAVRDTKDPQLNILSWSDTVAVMEVVHVWIIAKYGSVACCGTLFDHLAAQLDASMGGLFAKPFGKLTWKAKLYGKFKTKRRPENSEIAMDEVMASNICNGTKQLMTQGLTLKIVQPKALPACQEEQENAGANGRQQALWHEDGLDEMDDEDVGKAEEDVIKHKEHEGETKGASEIIPGKCLAAPCNPYFSPPPPTPPPPTPCTGKAPQMQRASAIARLRRSLRSLPHCLPQSLLTARASMQHLLILRSQVFYLRHGRASRVCRELG